MSVSKGCPDSDLKIKLAIRMDKPQNMKHCGYLWAIGKNVWKRWKKRFYVLVQLQREEGRACLDGGRTFFNAVKEGDTVIFASDDEQDRILWVQAMYRATGQSHKPIPPTQVQKLNNKAGSAPQLDAPISQFCKCHPLLCPRGPPHSRFTKNYSTQQSATPIYTAVMSNLTLYLSR
ncbi:unnamed protein product [Coregonus sp. 'balchen']|nr:unnamed protein product [Coregonus sp. 'balchen']